MKVVHVNDIGSVGELSEVVLELIDVNALGCALHHDGDEILDDRDGCDHDDDGEEVSAEWVCHPEAWVEVDACGGNDDPDRH